MSAGASVYVSEVADYEVRRDASEAIRAKAKELIDLHVATFGEGRKLCRSPSSPGRCSQTGNETQFPQ